MSNLQHKLVARVIFPCPSPSYTIDSFPGELVWLRGADGRPSTGDDAGGLGVGAEQGQGDETVPCLLLPFESARFLVIFFHSNAEDLGRCRWFCHFLREQFQVHILAVEYPGYGVCKGPATRERVLHSADAAMQFARQGLQLPLDRIKILGRSIGTGPALHLAAQHHLAGVILVTPFASVRQLFRDRVGHVASLIEEWFRNDAMIQAVESPTLIVHGRRDRIIPYWHAEELFKLSPAKKLLMHPEGMEHNTSLASDVAYLILPMFRFFTLPDYCFKEFVVPSWVFNKRRSHLYVRPDVEVCSSARPMATVSRGLATELPGGDEEFGTRPVDPDDEFAATLGAQAALSRNLEAALTQPTVRHSCEATKACYDFGARLLWRPALPEGATPFLVKLLLRQQAAGAAAEGAAASAVAAGGDAAGSSGRRRVVPTGLRADDMATVDVALADAASSLRSAPSGALPGLPPVSREPAAAGPAAATPEELATLSEDAVAAVEAALEAAAASGGEAIEVGARVQAHAGQALVGHGDADVYAQGDLGSVTDLFERDGQVRVKVQWDRTELSTSTPLKDWDAVMRKVGEAAFDPDEAEVAEITRCLTAQVAEEAKTSRFGEAAPPQAAPADGEASPALRLDEGGDEREVALPRQSGGGGGGLEPWSTRRANAETAGLNFFHTLQRPTLGRRLGASRPAAAVAEGAAKGGAAEGVRDAAAERRPTPSAPRRYLKSAPEARASAPDPSAVEDVSDDVSEDVEEAEEATAAMVVEVALAAAAGWRSRPRSPPPGGPPPVGGPLEPGARVQARAGERLLDEQGVEVYRGGDLGTVASVFERGGCCRAKVRWDRTGRATSTQMEAWSATLFRVCGGHHSAATAWCVEPTGSLTVDRGADLEFKLACDKVALASLGSHQPELCCAL